MIENQNWTAVSKELPPEGEYVLIHLNKNNWGDQSDPKGVYYKVAALEKGISLADREQMKAGELPDPADAIGYIELDGRLKMSITKRSDTYAGADEGHNNERPYQWVEFGPGKYFGQEVDYWMRIPRLNLK